MELRDDDLWQIADAGYQELWRLAYSRRGTMERDGEDNDGLSQQARTAASAGRHASARRFLNWFTDVASTTS